MNELSGLCRNRLISLMAVPSILISMAVDAEISQINHTSIEEVHVFGQNITQDTSIGRNMLELNEMGRSIQILDADLIATAKPNAIEDILALSSNVSFLGDNDGRENSFVLRGFQEPPILRDGFRVESFGGITDPELYNLERIEVLKGPDSILYGESNPGGLINTRLKRPLSEDHGEVALEIGSNPSVSPRFDVGAGLGDDVRYRVVGLYQHDDGWRDFENDNTRVFLAPSMTWTINNKTALTFISEWVEDDYQADFGTAIDTNGELLAPPEQINSHPQDTIERHSYTAGLDLSHKLNSQWQLEFRTRWFDSGYDYSALFLPFGLDQETLQYMRVPAQQGQKNDEIATQFNINGDFTIGGLRNRLSVGVDYRDSTTENSTRFNPGSPAFLDWTNPDYSQRPPAEQDIPVADGFYTNEDIRRTGIFVQNHLNVTDSLMLSVGARFDDVEREPLPGSSSSEQSYDNTSGQFGVRYELRDELSLFANYSESFSPNFDLDKNNNVLEPETGDGFELGVKGRLFNGQVRYTVAYFDITKNNVAVTDFTATPDDPNPLGSIAQGEQQSEGFEIDVQGAISENLSVIAALGYTDTNDENGLPIVGAADITASLWTTYSINSNWNAGGGFKYVGERFVTGETYLDSHIVINAYISYEVENWKYQLNLSNLADKEYIDAAWGGLSRSVHAGAPRQALASIQYTF